MEAGDDAAAGPHQGVVVGHRRLLQPVGDRRLLAVDRDAVDRPAQILDQGLELVGEEAGLEADRPGRRCGQLEVRIAEPGQGVLALAPEELRLGRRAAVDGDDLGRPRGAEEHLGEAADVDQLCSQRVDRAVPPAAPGGVAGGFVEVGLVGGDQPFDAVADHPLEEGQEQAEVDALLAVVEEPAGALAELRRHLLAVGHDRGAEGGGHALPQDDQSRSHGFPLSRAGHGLSSAASRVRGPLLGSYSSGGCGLTRAEKERPFLFRLGVRKSYSRRPRWS